MRAVLLVTLFASVAAAQNPIAWSLTGAPSKPGRATVRLKAAIESGWHLYGMSQAEDGPKPTRIWLPEGQPYTAAGEVKAPKAQRERDVNFNADVEYYEREVVFQIPVKLDAPANAPLRVNVAFQTCNDKLCLPPRTVTVTASR